MLSSLGRAVSRPRRIRTRREIFNIRLMRRFPRAKCTQRYTLDRRTKFDRDDFQN